MVITKYEHACVVIEDSGKRLVIDPGSFAKSLNDLKDISAVVITHVHPDHFDKDKVLAIIKQNPKVKVFTVNEVAQSLPKSSVMVAAPNSTCEYSGFSLEFSGGQHAQIHPSLPIA